MNAIRQFVRKVKKTGKRYPGLVRTVSMGRERTFHAWTLGEDTFIFEDGIASHLNERPSILIVDRRELNHRDSGRVMTMSTGNHSVAAFPLLDGRFWRLSRLPSAKRGEVLMTRILCANVVDGRTIETSQRDIPSKILFGLDGWLLETVGFALNDVIMGDRNVLTLEHYRQLGQEWRVKPLAWTEAEMKVALAASKKRISSGLVYYHSTRGVHFLSLSEFKRFATLAQTDLESFIRGLRELVTVYEGNRCSFTRLVKYRGHHEIELFGLRRGVSLERVIPELERLMEAITLGRIGQLGIIQKANEIAALYESQLSRPELADETSSVFIETIYMCVTGEVYSVVGEGMTPAFDDRRTALPGATYVDGRPILHPGADSRSEVLLSNLRGLMSKDEVVEYANVYELREDEGVPIGEGRTREVVYKTNRRPLTVSLIEKRLAHAARGYGSYMLARIGALRSLGVRLSAYYRLLRRRSHTGKRPVDFYIRARCEGEPMEAIPENYFRSIDDSSVEEKEVVLALAALMGDAAAQNMAMKKYDPALASPLYGVGKEIYEFEYDILRQRIVPKSVATCSIRGSFGWPCLDFTDENLRKMANFYLTNYAHTLKIYQKRHNVTMAEVAERFMGGFEFRTRALAWQLSVMRDEFESFQPDLPAHYGFGRKWKFLMWSLERQERRLPTIRKMFFNKVELIENEDIWNHPQ